MAIEITRLFDFPYYLHETYNLEKAFNTKYNGKWGVNFFPKIFR